MAAIESKFTKFNNKIIFGYMAQPSSVISNLYIRDYTISTTNFIKILKLKKRFGSSAFLSLHCNLSMSGFYVAMARLKLNIYIYTYSFLGFSRGYTAFNA